jgi:hypothetical protein
MTKVLSSSEKSGHIARSFLKLPYDATREAIAQRLVDDRSGRYGKIEPDKSVTFPGTFDHILARLSLFEKISANEGYAPPQFNSSAHSGRKGGVLAFPALILSEYPNANGPARRILYSLGSEAEVRWHFKSERHFAVRNPLVIGQKAIIMFNELENRYKDYPPRKTLRGPAFKAFEKVDR